MLTRIRAHLLSSLLLCLVSCLLLSWAWAAPLWHIFSPSGSGFSCKLPGDKVEESKIPGGKHWLLVEPGHYALQIGYVDIAGQQAEVDAFIKAYLEKAGIKESARHKITVNGLKGTEVTGSLVASNGVRLATKLDTFSTPKRMFFAAVLLSDTAAKPVESQFLKSFKLK